MEFTFDCRRSDSNMSSTAPEDRPFIFRVNDNGTGPVLLIQVCQERGWKEYDGTKSGDSAWSVPADEYWNLWWKSTGFSLSHYKQQKIWQFNNHIPSGSALCRKDNLWRYLKCMKNIFGTSLFGFSPDSYNLPLEYTKLAAECSHDTDVGEKSIWICKPVGQSQGKGISLISQIGDLVYDTNIVVQRYVKNPMLIGGYKYDLRLYVLVPSFHPLTIYIYREGLTRFSTDKYSLNNLDNHFAHLTNSSINKLGPNYSETKEKIGLGCKWTLQQLRQHIRQAGVNDWLLWQKISVLVSLTLASQCTGIPSTSNCFELYGFDILVDSDLKPWLLEVNLSPALGNDCDVDNRVKRPLLHDMFDLLGLPMCNTGLSLFRMACRSASGPRFGDGRPTALAAAATEKWKSKRKTNNNNVANNNNNNNNNVNNINVSKKDGTAPVTSTAQSQSSARQSTLYGPGKQRGATTAQAAAADLCNSPFSSPVWGNGRDWSRPVDSEGDWVRVFPFVPSPRQLPRTGVRPSQQQQFTRRPASSSPSETGTARVTIKTIQEYLKRCKKVARSCEGLSVVPDDELNDKLRDLFPAATMTWLPPH
ncbi:LOW QUALITY PROTEIN: probable tubulin polyglutamylase TTLL2 [Acyrthosiphon pisum]|uniref:Tubulin polyglutamylase TTLL2 n=1 Tax=Acyrthosiphon pisum TaxID=7029 RepID=A0A8R2FBG0_ACYPI|nr:LOW QUALITY PROTEIN: probable tubulin polyglutamylase TTLL2 [Acyrthosiphon pisum]|eukprot:XP_008187024.1 PREDICTED: LOW QUALITY PROTEIN: probable tubulin polyglutamylase TTLL2 [Acyrthosiphon pisum]